ncbi:hypothetical protein CHUAL_002654 [Chamberlinius hualienensis]
MRALRQGFRVLPSPPPNFKNVCAQQLLLTAKKMKKQPRKTDLKNLDQIDVWFELINMTPEEIFDGILNADEKIYTNENLMEIANLLPSKKQLKPLAAIPVNRLTQVEKLVALLSSVSYLREKVLLMKAKKNIKINDMKLRKAIYFSLENIQNMRENLTFNLLTGYLDTTVTYALGKKFPPFSYQQIVKEKLPSGVLFIDSFTNDILKSQRDKYNMPAVPAIREQLRQMKRDLKEMRNISIDISKASTHPNDSFDSVIKDFIATKLDSLKVLKPAAKDLDEEFDTLCRVYLIPVKSITIGDFFTNAIALRDAMLDSAKRIRNQQEAPTQA